MFTPLLLAALLALPVAAHAAPARKARSSAKPATVALKLLVPFIEDDFGRAMALARERQLPVFIEGWAPW